MSEQTENINKPYYHKKNVRYSNFTTRMIVKLKKKASLILDLLLTKEFVFNLQEGEKHLVF